ncbi:type II toxin-antitoxin system HicB family antitoxin [Facilibium subflavum]|uniref:type II toxin-antitoxin system HicB family antitoxin n=1 Tax=Facilibium subflavum TaxID=2219058 RepID=UPI001AAD64DF|nr:type II toxin-antitoxin system HicB family antitoxin [Facilibium subflavum]
MSTRQNLMKYKDYYGSIEFDEESMIFYGKVQFIRSLVSYEGETAKEILNAFHEAIDDYLATCKQNDVEPEKSFKGSFNIRIGTKLHEEVAIKANQMGTSVNDFVKAAIMHELNAKSL